MLLQHLESRRRRCGEQEEHNNDVERKHCCLVLGCMTGTSCDGIDLALVEFSNNNNNINRQFESYCRVLKFETLPYPSKLLSAIQHLLSSSSSSSTCSSSSSSTSATNSVLYSVCELNTLWSIEVGEVMNQFLKNYFSSSLFSSSSSSKSPPPVLIASHGQTIFHISGNSTLQLGDSEILSQVTNSTVVANFRAADIAVGGCGAPLIPYLDKQIASIALNSFRREKSNSSSKQNRNNNNKNNSALVFLQNLGGIGNVTVLKVSSSCDEVEVLAAFDTGPACVVVNELVNSLVNLEGDDGGRIAMFIKKQFLQQDENEDNKSWRRKLLNHFLNLKESGSLEEEKEENDEVPTFDQDAFYSKRGNADEQLVEKWIQSFEFFNSKALKNLNRGHSCGREQFGSAFVEKIIQQELLASPSQKKQEESLESFLKKFCCLCRTAIEFSSRTIQLHIAAVLQQQQQQQQQQDKEEEQERIFCCSGGGSIHPLLFDSLKHCLMSSSSSSSSSPLVHDVSRLSDRVQIAGLQKNQLDEVKEALAFALLGHEKIRSLAVGTHICDGGTNEPSATGAKKKVFLGQVSSPS